MKYRSSIVEALDGGQVLTAENIDHVVSEAQSQLGHVFPYLQVTKDSLGGKDRPSLIIRASLDAKEHWHNGIFHNSRFLIFLLHHDGNTSVTLGQRDPKFQQRKAKTPEEAIARISKWAQLAKSATP